MDDFVRYCEFGPNRWDFEQGVQYLFYLKETSQNQYSLQDVQYGIFVVVD